MGVFKRRRQPQIDDVVEFTEPRFGMAGRVFRVDRVERYILVLYEFGTPGAEVFNLNRGIFNMMGPRWIE